MQFDETQEQTRTFEVRETSVDTEKREIHGVGVPLEVETEIWPGFREVFDRDCQFDNIERAKLMAGHRQLIGVIVGHERTGNTLSVIGRASKTVAADEALALAKDTALDSFSIGFRSREYTKTEHDDGSITIRHTRVHVREFSLTDDPAYTGAIITDVRERAPENEGTTVTTETITREQVETTLDEKFTDFERTLDARLATLTAQKPAPTDTRSAGEVLQAIVDGDETAMREYNDLLERAYTGGTTAASPIKDGWVGDLTRIFDSSSGTLSAFFGTGTLPDKGMNIEYAQLKTNTVKVNEQEAEGDDLATGKIVLETKTAPVKTYGGYVELTVQQIRRSTLPILNRSLEAMALAAGARKKAVLRAAYLELVAARKALAAGAGVISLGADLDTATAENWTDIVVDAAVRFDTLDLAIDGAIVSPSVFKRLNNLQVDGHRVFKVADDRNTVGRLNLPGLTGDLAGITVVCDAGRTGDAFEFANSAAVRQYDSGIVQLQDENIINLSKAFSVYRFGAVAKEIPEAVVPVVFEA